jgi:serine/threonine-protein kinase
MDVMLGQYRVTGTIGRGGMGIVYAAEHALLGRPAAIKVLLSELSQKQDVVMRFFNEARAATAIRHPGIIEIYDFGWTSDGEAYLVMEHLEGETLGRRSARVPFRWPAVLAIARQIAGALAAAHAKGIVHRDLKPDNVFLVPDPEVPGGERIKLLDFGIAKLAVDSSTTVHVCETQRGSVIGTPSYMAPEQCRGVAVDHRADLYSLGCVMYELCCGRPPFRGEAPGDVLAAHIFMPVPAMSSAKVEIPEPVEALVRRLLAKPPGDRVQTAEQVIEAIDAVTGERTIAATEPHRAVTAMPTPGPAVTTLSGSAVMTARHPRTPHRRWSVAAFSAGLAAITVVIVTLVMRSDDAPSTVQSVPIVVHEPARSEPVPEPVRSEPVAAPTPAPDPPPPLAVDAVVESAPAGADVFLDGEKLGTTPFRGPIPRGDHDVKLVIRLAGFVDGAIVVHPTAPIHESVTLVRKPPAAPPKRAKPNRDSSVNPF